MPRSGDIYSKASGTTAVSGTTIEAIKYNATIDDIVTDLNTARPIASGGTGATNAAAALTALGAVAKAGDAMTGALNEAATLSFASATTTNIGAQNANTITITGTTTITAFDTVAAGVIRRLVFAGALTLTHNATSLILPSGANITTAAGDVFQFLSLGSGNWRCIGYAQASGGILNGSLYALLAGSTFSGNVAVNGTFALSRAVLSDTYVSYQTAGSLRWVMGRQGAAESGANAGSDFGFFRYSDAGGYLGAPLFIARASGIATFEATPLVGANPLYNTTNVNTWRPASRTTGVGSTVVASDAYSLIRCSAALTLDLTAGATLGDGFTCRIQNTSASGSITVDPSGAETIGGFTTLVITPGSGVITIIWNGTNWSYQGQLYGEVTTAATGTAVDFLVVPAWANWIEVLYEGVSTGATSNYIIQVGNGSFVVTGYVGSVQTWAPGGTGAGAAFSSSFVIQSAVLAADAHTGMIRLAKRGSNFWVMQSAISTTASSRNAFGSGFISLAGVLDRIKCTSVTPDTFDAGNITVRYGN